MSVSAAVSRPTRILAALLLSCVLVPAAGPADDSTEEPTAMRADPHQVRNWNRFVDDTYQLHLRQTRGAEVRRESRVGGYAPGIGGPDFYREDSYYGTVDDRLLSRIRWEREAVHSIHSIQVMTYDDQGRLAAEYIATYLPTFQNAPIQTFVNLHRQQGGLRAFRQFDAGGRMLYEQCRGTLEDESVWLESEFFPVPEEVRSTETYARCFNGLAQSPGERLDPLHGSDRVRQWPAYVPGSHEELEQLIEQYDRQIPRTRMRADLRVKRGDAYFLAGEFGRAVEDYQAALEIDDLLDEAYFGRGMARARLGQIREGIEDLDIFLERNPRSSLGYTKRGIRYLWLGDTERAEADFRRALEIDPDNAEAHSDLGVLLAQRGEHTQAILHMEAAVRNDPNYQKAFHNLAMVHLLEGRAMQAKASVDQALAIDPEARDSLMLKGEILKVLGRTEDGVALQEEARNLPQRDWSERTPMN